MDHVPMITQTLTRKHNRVQEPLMVYSMELNLLLLLLLLLMHHRPMIVLMMRSLSRMSLPLPSQRLLLPGPRPVRSQPCLPFHQLPIVKSSPRTMLWIIILNPIHPSTPALLLHPKKMISFKTLRIVPMPMVKMKRRCQLHSIMKSTQPQQWRMLQQYYVYSNVSWQMVWHLLWD